jgi:hypothetical protein
VWHVTSVESHLGVTNELKCYIGVEHRDQGVMATSIATRALRPRVAVILAGVC